MRLLCVQLLLIFVIHIKGQVVAKPRPSKIRPCSNTLQPPEITLADSDHLLIDWTKSFDSCKSSEVLIAFVQFQRSNVLKVSFTANKASVRANPCLAKREISVRLTYKQRLTFRFRNFCQIFEGFGFSFGFGKKVSVSVSKKFALGKKYRFWFRKIWFQKKSLGFGFEKIWSRKKVSVSVSENLVSEKKKSK